MSHLVQRTLNVFIRTQGKVFRTEFNVGLIDIDPEKPIPSEPWAKGYKFPEDFDPFDERPGIQVWTTYSTPKHPQQSENQ